MSAFDLPPPFASTPQRLFPSNELRAALRARLHQAVDCLSRANDALEVSDDSRVDGSYLEGQLERAMKDLLICQAAAILVKLTDEPDDQEHDADTIFFTDEELRAQADAAERKAGA